MHVGICVIELLVSESQSLKDKRRVINSIKDRVRNQFNVSIAEVEKLNNRQEATLGIAVISNDSKHANSVLSNVLNLVESSRIAEVAKTSVELLSYNTEVMTGE